MDFGDIRAAIRAVLHSMKPGQPLPKAAVSSDELEDVVGMIWRVFKEEYQEYGIGKIAAKYDGAETRAVPGCVMRETGPFRKVGEGANGAAWLNGDRTRIIKVGEVRLAEKEGHAVFEELEIARREFAIARRAGELGIGPAVHDAFFCCSRQHVCSYVIIMAAVQGESLTRWLYAGPSHAKRETMRKKVLALVAKLDAAGIEHTDLHSDNILVSPGDKPTVIDFGLATWSGASRRGDVESVNRIFSDTFTLAETARHVASALIVKGTIKIVKKTV